MILSASRRTDIPAYYSDWFFNRVREGYALVRNPMNAKQIRRIDLRPEAVEGIVFWTKNPTPMLNKLPRLKEYMYYFQFTLNAYDREVEEGIPSKESIVIPAFQRLSDRIGPDRVIWRYDPIFLNARYSFEAHIRNFENLARHLSPYTRKCVISFMDLYRKTEKNMADFDIQQMIAQTQRNLAKRLAEIAQAHGLKLETCAEQMDLEQYGVGHARCIDDRLLEKLLRRPLKVRKDRNQRRECGCVESVDIGAYNTCQGGCRYCYANSSAKAVRANLERHNARSPILIGEEKREEE